MRPSHRILKYLFVLAVSGTFLLVAAGLGITVLSGFFPASTDAKCRLIYGELRSIREVISDCWCAGGQVLPEDWKSLEAAEDYPDPNMVKDPFSGFEAQYLSQFSDRRIIVWSVGPDGIDSLDTSSEEVRGKDELVLIVNQIGGKLETQILDFSLGDGTVHREPPPPVTFGPENCD